MPRSNAPLALSVVTLTEPGNIDATFNNITAFDDNDFGFNHNQTWAALPFALRGVLHPDRVASSFKKAPVRVQRCIVALCELGAEVRRETKRFADFPDAGVRAVQSIDWDPEVRVRVKATCWYINHGRTVLPVLQPRKMALDVERLAVYVRLVRQAYCQGDWLDALIELIDLSGDGDIVTAVPVDLSTLPAISDKLIGQYVHTFVQAKKLADEKRKTRVKEPAILPLADLLGIVD